MQNATQVDVSFFSRFARQDIGVVAGRSATAVIPVPRIYLL